MTVHHWFPWTIIRGEKKVKKCFLGKIAGLHSSKDKPIDAFVRQKRIEVHVKDMYCDY